MDRRHFMGIGGAAAALLRSTPAEAASWTPTTSGRSVLDWGVEPNLDRDQSPAMQKAIDELTAAGQPIVIPAGLYHAGKLQLSSRAAVFGVPGLTVLTAPSGLSVFDCTNKQHLNLRGLSFIGTALIAKNCLNVSVFDCQILSSPADGLYCSGAGLLVSSNRVSSCARSAIWIEGDGMVTTNLVNSNGQFGLRLGGSGKLGTMSIINNTISGAAVGIAASNADGGYALIMMNIISGAKNGGIRALNGDEVIGKDLTKGGSEAFRNLGIAANVSI